MRARHAYARVVDVLDDVVLHDEGGRITKIDRARQSAKVVSFDDGGGIAHQVYCLVTNLVDLAKPLDKIIPNHGMCRLTESNCRKMMREFVELNRQIGGFPANHAICWTSAFDKLTGVLKPRRRIVFYDAVGNSNLAPDG